jgi:hypothetical protein
MITHITKADPYPKYVETYCGSKLNKALHLHFWLMDGAPEEGFCPDCLASEELGLDLLSDRVDADHAARVRAIYNSL